MTDRINFNGPRLGQFQALLDNRQLGDNERIRLTDRNELTAANFGFFTRKATRISVNSTVARAFKDALKTDGRYQNILTTLGPFLDRAFSDSEGLTPGRIRTTIDQAETMLKAFKNRQMAGLLSHLAGQGHLLPEELTPGFKDFVINQYEKGDDFYELFHIREFGQKNNLPAAQRTQAEGPQLAAKIRDFDTRCYRRICSAVADFYRTLPADSPELPHLEARHCGGDANRAEAMQSLFATIFDPAEEIATLLGQMEDEEIPAQGEFPGDITQILGQKMMARLQYDIGDKVDLQGTSPKVLKELAGVLRGMKEHLTPSNRAALIGSVHTFITMRGNSAGEVPADELEAFTRELGSLSPNAPRGAYARVALKCTAQGLLQLPDLQVRIAKGLPERAGLDAEDLGALLQEGPLLEQLVTKMAAGAKQMAAGTYRPEFVRFAQNLLQETRPTLEFAIRQVTADKTAPEERISQIATVMDAHQAMGQLMGALAGEPVDTVDLIGRLRTLDHKLTATGRDGAAMAGLLTSLLQARGCVDPEGGRHDVSAVQAQLTRLRTLALGLDEFARRPHEGNLQDFAGPAADLSALAHSLANLGLAATKFDFATEPQVVDLPPMPEVQAGMAGRPVPRGSEVEIYAAMEAVRANDEISQDKKDRMLTFIRATGCTDTELLTELADRKGFLLMPDRVLNAANLSELSPAFTFFCNDLGGFITNIAQRFPRYSVSSLTALFRDALLNQATAEQKDLLRNFMNDPQKRQLVEVVNNTAIIDERELASRKNEMAPVAWQSRHENCQRLKHGVALMHELCAGLGVPSPITPGVSTATTIYDIKGEAHVFREKLADMSKFGTTILDEALADLITVPAPEDRRLLNEFFLNLQLPLPEDEEGGDPHLWANSELSVHQSFGRYFVDRMNGTREFDSWSLKSVAILVACSAHELLPLLKQTDGHPTAQQIWQVMLPEVAVPDDLDEGNLMQKCMTYYAELNEQYGTLKGGVNYLSTLIDQVYKQGLSPLAFLRKAANCPTEGIVFRNTDLDRIAHGTFFIGDMDGTLFMDGEKNFNFDEDLARADMPLMAPGTDPQILNEGFKIEFVGGHQAVPTTTGAQVNEFVRSENQRDSSRKRDACVHDFMSGFTRQIAGFLGDPELKRDNTRKQLSALGYLTSQATQTSLKNTFYVPFGTNEHTALDYKVTLLDNGTVQLDIREKPGALFKFDHSYEISPEGRITVKSATTIYPSLEQIRQASAA